MLSAAQQSARACVLHWFLLPPTPPPYRGDAGTGTGGCFTYSSFAAWLRIPWVRKPLCFTRASRKSAPTLLGRETLFWLYRMANSSGLYPRGVNHFHLPRLFALQISWKRSFALKSVRASVHEEYRRPNGYWSANSP